MAGEKWIAVIGDLIASRELDERDLVQAQLESVLQEINTRFAYHIKSLFVVTIGDEFQGLVSRTFPVRDFFNLYAEKFGSRYSTRFGIGLGELSTPPKKEAIGMDGRCFHHAREALEIAKKGKHSVRFMGFEFDIAVNALFHLIQDLEQRWTKRQREILSLYQNLRDYAAVARELNITRQSVFDSVSASRFELYNEAWDGLQQLITFVKE